MLRNAGFEDGHYHQDGIPELGVPNWWRLHFLDGVPYPGGAEPPIAARPESRVWYIGDAPEHERGIFFLGGEHCLKVFKAGAPVYFALEQTVEDLIPGHTYRFTANVYPDLVAGYDGAKVRPDDKWAGEVRAGVSLSGVTWIAGEEDGEIAWGDWFNVNNGTMTFGVWRGLG